MSVSGGPDIVENGLVTFLDAASIKSYSGSGTDWLDISKNGNNATLTNGPTFTTANKGAIIFDGTDDIASLSTANWTYFNNRASWTVSTWARLNTGLLWYNPYPIFGNDDGGSNSAYIAISGGGQYRDWFFLRWYIATNVYTSGDSFPIYAGRYYHLSVVFYSVGTGFTDGRIEMYINGSLAYTTNSQQTNGVNTYLTLGRGRNITGGFYWPFPGRISSFMFYNRRLNAEEIVKNFNATKGRFGV
jgi:hypothetical protein